MANRTKKNISLESYQHVKETRVNNPPVGLVSSATDIQSGKTKYQHDPHIDPQLDWAGKAEGISFEVPNVSLHIHERIDPQNLAKSFLKRQNQPTQPSLFDNPDNDLPLLKAIHFYRHEQEWSNRLVAGDSLLVMNSLLQKEAMAGKVQMIYIDPPYGIKYNSNFQPFLSQTALKSNDDDNDLVSEPEMIKAFRDTWELGTHSYLSYLRDRILLSKELLNETGSVFIQISEENIHRVRLILDEIFGDGNFISQITIKKASVMFSKKLLNSSCFYLLWYAKNKEKIKYRQLFTDKETQWFADNAGSHLWFENIKTKEVRKVTPKEREDIQESLLKNQDYKIFGTWSLNAQGSEKQKGYEFEGKIYFPPIGTQWKTAFPEGLDKLRSQNRLQVEGNNLRVKLYPEDFPVMSINNLWDGIGAASNKIYVVQTSEELAKRCVLMTTDTGDIVLDPTCGSGTTAFAAEQWGRRWITCDTSRVAITLAKQRLMTAKFDYYELAHPDEGVRSGFKYKTVPHVTLGSIANDEPPKEETLYDQPIIDKSKVRVTGPFTVEAVPSLRVKAFDGQTQRMQLKGSELARNEETNYLYQWIDELKASGIRATGGKIINFGNIEPLAGTRYLHASAEMLIEDGKMQKAVISFGPDYGPLEQRQVEEAMKEAMALAEVPEMVVFTAFHFDPEAGKDIDLINESGSGFTLLKAQMSVDLLTGDLRKKRSSNQSYWLIGQPDIEVIKLSDGKFQVKVNGFDYYNPVTAEIESGSDKQIAMWMLDTDYDEQSILPDQVFFPTGDSKRDWTKLAKALNGTVDVDLLEQFVGTESLPFKLGDNKKIAVKIIDNRGIESLVVKHL